MDDNPIADQLSLTGPSLVIHPSTHTSCSSRVIQVRRELVLGIEGGVGLGLGGGEGGVVEYP